MVIHPLKLHRLFSTNLARKKIPRQRTFVVILLFFCIILLLFYAANLLSVNQATVLGVAGSTIFAILVFFLSRSNEDYREYLAARNNAQVLHEILHHIEMEMQYITSGYLQRIDYPANWLSIYTNVASFLNYNYLGALINTFSAVDEINDAISAHDIKTAQKLIKYYWTQSFRKWNDFDTAAISQNLFLFSSGQPEEKHWSEQERYREFFDSFLVHYSDIVHSLTIDYLMCNEGHCDESDAALYVLNQLKSEKDFLQKYPTVPLYDRELLLVIFTVHLNSKDSKKYSLTWGELSLVENS